MRHAYIGLLITACAGEPFSGTEVLGYAKDSSAALDVEPSETFSPDGSIGNDAGIIDGASGDIVSGEVSPDAAHDSWVDSSVDVRAENCSRGGSFEHCAPKSTPNCPIGYHAVSVCDCDNKPCYPLVTLECVCDD